MQSGSTRVHLFNEDCIAGMQKIDADAIGLIVTSPPYNLGIDYSHYEDNRTPQEYLEWTLKWATEAHRVLAEDGALFLNIGGSPRNPLLPHEVLLTLSKLFVLQNTFHWIKAITVTTRAGKEISAGHFKPINSKRFVNDCHEYIFHLTKSGTTPVDRLGVGVEYADKSNIKRWSHTQGKDRRCRGNNWFIPYQTINNRDQDRPHPATFPVELPAMCIRLHGWRPDLVMLDPFVGIGHSAMAALQYSIKEFYGFDIDAAYLQTAREAVQEYQSGRHANQPLLQLGANT